MAVDISDLPPPPKVDISDLPAPAKAPEPPSVGEKAYAFGRGLIKGVAETPRQLEDIARFGPKFPNIPPSPKYFPGGEEVSKGMAAVGLPEPSKAVSGYQTAGELAPAVIGGGKALLQMGKFGITKAGELAKTLRRPEPIAEVKDLAEVGEKGFKLLTTKAENLFKQRSAEAEKLYGNAYDTARAAQATGQPFATSPAGQWLLQTLENEKRVLAGGKEFARGEEKVAGINRLINAIKGSTTGGYTRTAKEAPGGKKIFYTEGTPKKTVEKDIEAVVEELRFLRDVDAKGKPYEAYAALDAKYKRDLIDKLERSLYSWNDQYRVADQAYRAASQKLEPFKTSLMSGALKGEKFDPKSLVKSPEEFGRTFFSDVDGVRQLKKVTEDAAAVNGLAKEYVATVLSNKSPQEVAKFASDPKNAAWMKEAGIKDAVDQFAKQATTAESRTNILKKLGYTAAGGAVGGGTVYYGLRRTFGL